MMAGPAEVRPEKTKVMMLTFLASEAVFFVFLILGYLYYRGAITSGPDASKNLNPALTGIYTICLLASSGTLYAAERARRLNRSGFTLWLGMTVLLGVVFMAGQALEYARLMGQNVTAARNLFGATFFTLTGFHGFHVCMGIAALATLLGLSTTASFGVRETRALEAVSLYWHFVDVVWILIFSLVYLAAL